MKRGTSPTQRRGHAAEDVALAFLRASGLRLLHRNYHCRAGEIDLIMRDAAHLIMVEIRRRAATRFADAIASVDARKQRRLVRTAGWFITHHPEHAALAVRFDVVGLDTTPDTTRLTWLRNAFDAAAGGDWA